MVDVRQLKITDAERRADAERRRALALLGATVDGCTTTLLSKHGITPKLIVELLTTGLATAQAKRTAASGKIDDLRIRITPVGRVALER